MGCGAVVHLADQVAVTTSLTDPVTDFDVNARAPAVEQQSQAGLRLRASQPGARAKLVAHEFAKIAGDA